MKQFRALLLLAALITSACTKEQLADEGYSPAEGEPITFHVSGVEGRTAFGESTDEGATYPTLWSEGDMIKVNYNLAYDEENTRSKTLNDPATSNNPKVTVSSDRKSATFTVSMAEDVTYPCTFYAVSPASSWTHWNDTESGCFFLQMPTEQTANAASCDPKGQILIGQSALYDAEQNNMKLSFSHFAAYGLMSLTGLPEDILLYSVTITAEQGIAGTLYYNVADKTYEGSNLKKTITITTAVKDKVWFAALPADLSNTELTVLVKTSKGEYTKTITLPADRKLVSGRIARFSVDLTDIEPVKSEGVQLRDIWFENGKPVGIVYWISEDKETIKIVHLQRSEPMKWNDPVTQTTVNENPAIETSHTNTEDLYTWAAQNPTIQFPALDYLTELNKNGDSWYWPTRRDMEALAKVYYGAETITKANKNSLKTSAPEQYAATQSFETLLTSIETDYSVDTDPLDNAAETSNGDVYWTSCDYKSAKAWFGRFGTYYVNASAKTNTYYCRAVKTITNASSRKLEEQLRAGTWTTQTLREGVKIHSGSVTFCDRTQKIYVAEITPSATNQIGIYHAGADTPKQIATQAASAGALAAVNGGFFPMENAMAKTGFVRINSVDKEQGDNEVSGSFAGGALVINGTTPGIKKVTGNEAARELTDENILVCGPLLLLDGKKQTLSDSSTHTTSYSQRTIVGITENGTFLMVVVHGRDTDNNIAGMDCFELQDLMIGLRVKHALNLDGGASSALWANGSYVYSTTRSVANIVYVK